MTSLVPSTVDYQVLQSLAKTAHQSGLYRGVGGEANILMVLLAANDLGIKPTIALNGGIWNIKGKIELSARLMTSMIRRAGHSIKIKQLDSQVCILEGCRLDSKDTMEAKFSFDDARKANLTANSAWQKYTEDMLYARALSRLARRLFPDLIGTAYVEGEIRDGDIKDVTSDVEITNCQEEAFFEPPKQESPYITENQAFELEKILSNCSDETKEGIEKYFEEAGHRFDKLEKSAFEKWRNNLIAKSQYISEKQAFELEEILSNCSDETKENVEKYFENLGHRFDKLEKSAFEKWRDNLISKSQS